MTLPVEHRRYSINDYLRMEHDSIERHEFLNGDILSMAGGTYNHSLIIANFSGELRNRLKGNPCRVLESNLRVRVPRTPLYSYPDVSVICGKPEIDPEDNRGETITNPRVLIEVLSASTEAYDRGEKFSRYRMLDSLEEYILVSQTAPSVETFLRQSEGTWLLSSYSSLKAFAQLRSLKVELPLAEIYAGVEFSIDSSSEHQGP